MRTLQKVCLSAFFFFFAFPLFAQLSPDLQKKIDDIATQTLAATGVPSASLAVVKDGKIVYARAYGHAHLDPAVAATPEMRYCIGSISKQFTAAAILLLAEQGKLSLDDPVSKFIPNLTRGNEVTLRELLSHTSGYQDFWPQDYVMPMMLKPVTAQQILEGWARIPLDFDPGTQWQYSNTNFVIAGLIVEKASGMPFMKFLQQHLFTPLGMKSVLTIEEAKALPSEPAGYLRYALGPPRPAPVEGQGWMFAAGELSMTASDLARWDISLIDQSVLRPASYHEMETEVELKNGVGTRYGLGIAVNFDNGQRVLSHGGEVSGFVAQNVVFPDDHAAIVVLTNLDASAAAGQIARRIRPLLFPVQDKNMEERLQLAKKVFAGLQHGQIDRSLFTENCLSYFTPQALADFASSLGPLGEPADFRQTAYSLRGGMGFRAYLVKFQSKSVRITLRDLPDGGKIEQFQVAAAE
ncbi:MAG TPA: serine hydrolase domain-containing protein [Terriglobales bacterium]|nr:serine hydrolase domain-containing protein [Terriglobales bacterium]